MPRFAWRVEHTATAGCWPRCYSSLWRCWPAYAAARHYLSGGFQLRANYMAGRQPSRRGARQLPSGCAAESGSQPLSLTGAHLSSGLPAQPSPIPGVALFAAHRPSRTTRGEFRMHGLPTEAGRADVRTPRTGLSLHWDEQMLAADQSRRWMRHLPDQFPSASRATLSSGRRLVEQRLSQLSSALDGRGRETDPRLVRRGSGLYGRLVPTSHLAKHDALHSDAWRSSFGDCAPTPARSINCSVTRRRAADYRAHACLPELRICLAATRLRRPRRRHGRTALDTWAERAAGETGARPGRKSHTFANYMRELAGPSVFPSSTMLRRTTRRTRSVAA